MNKEAVPFSSEDIRKIAILRALNLGDTLCIIPSVRAIKEAFPDAEITLIGLPWQKDFTKRFSRYFNDFIVFPGWPGLPEQAFEPSGVTAFLQQVQHSQFDLVLQMQGDGSFTNPMCMLFDAKKVAGLRIKGNYCPDEALFPPLNEKENEILRFLYLVHEALGIPAEDTELEFPIFEKEFRRYEEMSEQLQLVPGRYICLHPGARDPRRRWPVENFAFTADQLAAAGYTVVITGDAEEKALTRKVAQSMRLPSIDLVAAYGHLGLGELAAFIKNAAALLSNDTGVSHIAAATKTPGVVIFSPYSDPKRWAPLDRERHISIPEEQSADPMNVVKALHRLLNLKNMIVTHESFHSYSYV